jgi:MFS family permease
MSIFPYVYFMIKDFGVTKHEAEIAVYAGMVTSAFAFAEFSSGVVWGRLSDRIGRKPVLITGLAGTALSMLIFGFAPNLPVALLARALGGLLNGYVDVPGSCTDAVRWSCGPSSNQPMRLETSVFCRPQSRKW